MIKVYLSLGSNIGNKQGYLKRAVALLKTDPSIKNIEVSSYYETEPQGYVDQESFINIAVGCETTLTAANLLKLCQSIEAKLKRVRLFRWGPRTIDIDILLYGDQCINSSDLTVPHPRMFDRAFVMVPLTELNSNYNEYLEHLGDQSVKRI